MAIIPKSPFPNVPQQPGVPQIARSPLSPTSVLPTLGVALGAIALWRTLFSKSQWGIYKSLNTHSKDAQVIASDGTTLEEVVVTGTAPNTRKPIVVPDSFGEFSYRNEWSLSDFPVQEGEFSSYNKVANPFEISLRMYKGGTKEARAKFIESIEAIQGTLDLYDIFTPEKTYLGVNILRFEMSRRGPRDAFFLSEVDLYFREIREVTAVYTTTSVVTLNAQNASAAPATNNGVVQAQSTTMTPAGAGL